MEIILKIHGNTNEERLQAIKNSKRKYTNTKEWVCDICKKKYLLKNK